jgi:hypothetical protein
LPLKHKAEEDIKGKKVIVYGQVWFIHTHSFDGQSN